MNCQSIGSFRLFQGQEVVLGEDQPIFFQLAVMIAHSSGRCLGLAGTLLRSLGELFDLLPEIDQHGSISASRHLCSTMAGRRYPFVMIGRTNEASVYASPQEGAKPPIWIQPTALPWQQEEEKRHRAGSGRCRGPKELTLRANALKRHFRGYVL